MNHSESVSILWGVADLIRDTFKRGKHQDVILPLTVLRRLDCVLAATKEKVLARQAALLAAFRDGETRRVTKDGNKEDVVVSRVFPSTRFGCRKITV
jgi:type I restriction enzyme M protein